MEKLLTRRFAGTARRCLALAVVFTFGMGWASPLCTAKAAPQKTLETRFGVNYYPPFSGEYRLLKERGLDHKEQMRRDVAHFRRLGLDCIRLHTFDAEFSTKAGGFVDNAHVELLDYLISLCATNGIKTVLTPIAWWRSSTEGFSADWTIQQMVSDPRAWAIQERFLREFADHVNRYTGKRYADDPAIIAFELINEPHYPADWPDAKVTEYIDRLAAALRSSGTTKPLFYNCWEGRTAACGASTIDGVSGNDYPTGLIADRELRGSQLGRIAATTLKGDAHVADKLKMIYEFDCADVGGAFMYPAMAREFRHEGCSVANQFQYDMLALADRNLAWKTHHLNLVYTPAKAISFAIAAEVFRRSPLGCSYRPDVDALRFDDIGVRIDARRNLSQLVTDADYLYTADPLDPPPNPASLRRVWGVGTSSVASVTGNGAYFLDRAVRGVWRLQLYPNVVDLADPYSGNTSPKHLIVREARTVRLTLPALSTAYRVRKADAPESVVATAVGGTVELMPGDYVVESVASFGADAQTALAALQTPPFVCPAYPTPSDFEFLDVTLAVRHGQVGEPDVRRYVAKGPQSLDAFGFTTSAERFKKGDLAQHTPFDAVSFERVFGRPGPGREVVATLRAPDGKPGTVRLIFTLANETYYGWDFPLTADWTTVRVPVKDLKPFWGTETNPSAPPPNLGLVRTVSAVFSGPVEIASVKVQFE